jgi:hypothetical protein
MAGISKTQKILWDSYLASGRGGVDIFKSIDTDNSGTISASELREFLSSIGRDDVNEHAFIGDHEVNLKEFLSHLVLSTQGETQGLKSIQMSYEAQPVGKRSSMVMSTTGGLRASMVKNLQAMADGEEDNKEEEDEYAWNETTMAQNLRKMQYAVRGEVVMKATVMQTEGREITFTVRERKLCEVGYVYYNLIDLGFASL